MTIHTHKKKIIRRNKFCFYLLLGFFSVMSSPESKALDANDSLIPTFYAQLIAGYAIYKSNLVKNNDSSVATNYAFGINAGQEKNIGMGLIRDQANFAFALNNSSINYQLQDFYLRYRYSIFHAGLIVTASYWKIESPPDQDSDGLPDPAGTAALVLDGMGTGYGANLGLNFNILRKSTAFFEATYTAAQTPLAKAIPDAESGVLVEKDIYIGPRTEVDLGARYSVSKTLDAVTGFRYRMFSLGVDNTNVSELTTMTYVGIRYELNN